MNNVPIGVDRYLLAKGCHCIVCNRRCKLFLLETGEYFVRPAHFRVFNASSTIKQRETFEYLQPQLWKGLHFQKLSLLVMCLLTVREKSKMFHPPTLKQLFKVEYGYNKVEGDEDQMVS